MDIDSEELEGKPLPPTISTPKPPTTKHEPEVLHSPSPPPSPAHVDQPTRRLHANSSPSKVPERRRNEPEFSSNLTPFDIAHCERVQNLFDAYDLAWGTIYEIARGVTQGSWDWSAVTSEKLDRLRGTNTVAAHKVSAVMKGREVPRSPVPEIWYEICYICHIRRPLTWIRVEFDREQDAILENEGRGLGGMGQWKGKDAWYGGRIQQVGRLQRVRGKFTIRLEKPEIRRSHRFSRFLGSRRILQVRVVDDLLYKYGDDVRSLLTSSKFILCGRVFVPFHAKEGSVYMMETNEDYQRTANWRDGDQFRKSLKDFLDWHNPLHFNSSQPISKWSTRWALGLSTSVPTIEFEARNIFFIEDEYVNPQDWTGKAPAEKVLTDGCGWINGAALTQIMRIMKYASRPTAVQGRVGGSKGMWLLHPDPPEQVADGPAKIWIRDSQTKIKLGKLDQLGRSQRIFDLLAPSRVTGPSRLSAQLLINLSHNGVPHRVLKELMALGLQDEIDQLVDWDQPHSMVAVWKAVERAGHVIMGRVRRQLAGQARALGLGQLRPQDDRVGDDDEEVDENEATLPLDTGGRKQHSGQPLTLHESVLELLQAGFHPLKLDLLFNKLESIISLVLDDYVEKFHIPVPESREAYIVPDPYGVLEEGEIHFRSSEMITDPSTGAQTDTITGDVLVSRNPTRLPSDVQKVNVMIYIVYIIPKLYSYFDVIVFPTKGTQSLASYLGGGDTVMLTWCKALVENFRSSPLTEAPNDLTQAFEREVEHVRDFDKRASKLPPKGAQQAFQKVLLLGLAETRVGLYSKFHDAAVYEHGYASQKAINLAYMFTTCLDASKTGLRVKLPVFDRDRQQWGPKKPWYAWKLEQSKGTKIKGQQPSSKRQGVPFILDVLVEEGDTLRKQCLRKYRQLKDAHRDMDAEDRDLTQPWHAAKSRAAQAQAAGIRGFAENLNDIENHVHASWATSSNSTSSKDGAFVEVARDFAKCPAFRGFQCFSDEDVRTLKTSLAASKSRQFAFSTGFQELCAIKATGNWECRIYSPICTMHVCSQRGYTYVFSSSRQ
ncbi:RNA dependent RNA polymerase-domain-containing protein [Melanogaster broomeanus]|nr:RNA dependent RNA polymerase-domain-containing protein [Melanogaster broomeanus]